MKIFTTALALLSLTISTIPHVLADTPADTIKIVSSLPRTGSANAKTTAIVNGIRMALEEVNYQAGPFKITYEDWDDASPRRGSWDPAVEAKNADNAIKDPNVMAYIGTYNSGAAKIAMPKLNHASLVMVSPANTYAGLTKKGLGEKNEPQVYRPSGKVNFFRVVPADDIQGTAGADWAKGLGYQKVFVLHDRELYGIGIAAMFKARAQALGLTLVGYEGLDPKASNYKALVTKIKQQAPDLVYYGGTTETNAGQLAKDLTSSGVTAKLMVPDGCFEQIFIDAAGQNNVNERVYITFGGIPGKELTGKGKLFYERYKEKYKEEPAGYAVYGYEAAKVVLEGIKRAGKKDREAIRAAIAQTKDFDGALGRWSFDAEGDTSLRIVSGNRVTGGDFAFVQLLGQ